MLTPLQEQLAALVAGLPEAADFALAGGGGLAAHGLLHRGTRDLDFFGPPQLKGDAVALLAHAVEQACARQGLTVQRERDGETFVRLTVASEQDSCEIDIAIDYRALDPVETRYGPAMDLRELGANKVLAIFDRALPRDFIDLTELTKRFPLHDLIALAAEKDLGFDLGLLDQAMNRMNRLPRESFGVDDNTYRAVLAAVSEWQVQIRQLIDPQAVDERDSRVGDLGTAPEL